MSSIYVRTAALTAVLVAHAVIVLGDMVSAAAHPSSRHDGAPFAATASTSLPDRHSVVTPPRSALTSESVYWDSKNVNEGPESRSSCRFDYYLSQVPG